MAMDVFPYEDTLCIGIALPASVLSMWWNSPYKTSSNSLHTMNCLLDQIKTPEVVPKWTVSSMRESIHIQHPSLSEFYSHRDTIDPPTYPNKSTFQRHLGD